MASLTITVPAGQSQILDLAAKSLDVPIGITIHPGAGGTALLEGSRTDTAVSNPGAARWVPSTAGTVSVATEQALFAPLVALRLTATTQPAVFELVSQ